MLITIQSKERVFRAEVNDFCSWSGKLIEAFLDGCRAMGYIIPEYNSDLIQGIEDAREEIRSERDACCDKREADDDYDEPRGETVPNGYRESEDIP